MKQISREEYHKLLGNKKIFGRDNCPFCEREKIKDQVIWEGEKWYIIYNFSSYSGDNRHIMAIPKEHIVLSKDLSEDYTRELKKVYEFAHDFFKDDTFFSFTRESIIDESRSVEHLHIHFLVGILHGKFLRKMLELQGFPIKQDLNSNIP